MKIGQRLRRIEDKLGVRRTPRVFILWTGLGKDHDRERADEAHRNGWEIDLVILTQITVADSEEEAQAVIETHKTESPGLACTVCLRDKPHEVVLAKWDPGLPEWLQSR